MFRMSVVPADTIHDAIVSRLASHSHATCGVQTRVGERGTRNDSGDKGGVASFGVLAAGRLPRRAKLAYASSAPSGKQLGDWGTESWLQQHWARGLRSP